MKTLLHLCVRAESLETWRVIVSRLTLLPDPTTQNEMLGVWLLIRHNSNKIETRYHDPETLNPKPLTRNSKA